MKEKLINIEDYISDKTNFEKIKDLCFSIVEIVIPYLKDVNDSIIKELNEILINNIKNDLTELFNKLNDSEFNFNKEDVTNAYNYAINEVKIIINSNISENERYNELCIFLISLPYDYNKILNLEKAS